MQPEPLLAQIRALFAAKGELDYGEGVTQLAHALQSAALAEAEGASAAEITAALLHDIGHLLHTRGEDIAERGIDARHERIGATWLRRHFPPEVSEAVRLHVSAKRYRVTKDPSYLETLSDASKLSLKLQGGPMSDLELRSFEDEPFFEAALRLRRWDDEAKDPDRQTPPLEHFLTAVASSALRDEDRP